MRWSTVAACVVVLTGCEPSRSLVVDLRTDFVAGAEITRVQTRLLDGEGPPAEAPTLTLIDHPVEPGADYARGVRVAELPELPNTTARLSVRLVGHDELRRRSTTRRAARSPRAGARRPTRSR